MAERDPNENEAGARDDDAAWAEIVAAYGEEPGGGASPWPEAEDVIREARGRDGDGGDEARGREGDGDAARGREGDGREGDGRAGSGRAPGGSVVFAPGVGPRDWQPAEASDDDFDETDEGHFVPPDPSLPESDTASRFAWLGVIGGPLLLIGSVVFQVAITWWIVTVGIGGFLGGLATLVLRMRADDDEEDDPGRGAVV
ncbi:hypothetical protein RKE29_20735 [Streptomyces sp. B1866]|uniref:hypothetical protein n=1 Tax=Streptomyces sp. B1866 TaxID=3075431 RepID=UPI0028910F31|nr:hypothetical protein [Streptomyces sp. B1866]MDT3399041.1 hypothetical protein [Streptomyces sp. B1866]